MDGSSSSLWPLRQWGGGRGGGGGGEERAKGRVRRGGEEGEGERGREGEER